MSDLPFPFNRTPLTFSHKSIRSSTTPSHEDHHSNLMLTSMRRRQFRSKNRMDQQQKAEMLLEMREMLMTEYTALLKFYQTNEIKLHQIIWKQLQRGNQYLYSKQVMGFIRSADLQPLKRLNLDVFRNDISKICQFLTNMSSSKKMKQVDIIKQSLINREKLIRESTSCEQYEQVFKTMRTPIKSGYTIYDQYRSIRSSFNMETHKENIHERLYTKISDVEIYVCDFMRDKLIKMEELKFKLRGRKYL